MSGMVYGKGTWSVCVTAETDEPRAAAVRCDCTAEIIPGTVGVYAAAGRRTKTSGTDSKTRAGRKETHKPVSKIIPKYVKEN